jgi:hypothetical protein
VAHIQTSWERAIAARAKRLRGGQGARGPRKAAAPG